MWLINTFISSPNFNHFTLFNHFTFEMINIIDWPITEWLTKYFWSVYFLTFLFLFTIFVFTGQKTFEHYQMKNIQFIRSTSHFFRGHEIWDNNSVVSSHFYLKSCKKVWNNKDSPFILKAPTIMFLWLVLI